MTEAARIVQENDRLPWVKLLVLAGLSIVVVVAAVVASTFVADSRIAKAAVEPFVKGVATMPEKTLIESSARLARERQAQRDQLDQYGWVDRDAGVVRIPIEQAMDLMVQRGH